MTDLEALIQFWETMLSMNPSAYSYKFILRVRETIRALEKLKELKGE